MRRVPGIVRGVIIIVALARCGDPTDRPEDCSPNEYFDESRKLCFTCPAPREPRCDEGCGIQIVTDDRGCPLAECIIGDDCTACGATEYVDDTLQCVACDGPQTCAEGAAPRRRIADGACTLTCP